MYYIVTFFFVDSESMLESMTRPTENVVTNWMLIGICVSVGVLFGVTSLCGNHNFDYYFDNKKRYIVKCACMHINLIFVEYHYPERIPLCIFSGFGHQQQDGTESTTSVERQEKDINMSKNIIYEQIKYYRKQKIELQENVTYCSMSAVFPLDL